MFSFKFLLFSGLGSIVIEKTLAVPPDACFANFRWDDCGLPAKPVMYYWKPGSRCEVGLWKGCLPNQNMFEDEYECVRTCIFADRAGPEDYHVIHNIDSTAQVLVDRNFEPSVTDGSSTTGGTDAIDTDGTTGSGDTDNTEGGTATESSNVATEAASDSTDGTAATDGNSDNPSEDPASVTTEAPAT